jgi:hypothetical protein
VPGRLLKIEARQGKEHECGKAEKNDGADPPFAIVVLFHIGTSHWFVNARAGERFRRRTSAEQMPVTSGCRC